MCLTDLAKEKEDITRRYKKKIRRCPVLKYCSLVVVYQKYIIINYLFLSGPALCNLIKAKKKKKFNQPVADFVYEPVIDFEVHMNFIFHKLYHSVKFRIRSIIIRSSIICFCFICYISACPYVALCYTEYACLWRQKLFLSSTEHHYVSLSMLCNPHVFLCWIMATLFICLLLCPHSSLLTLFCSFLILYLVLKSGVSEVSS